MSENTKAYQDETYILMVDQPASAGWRYSF